MGVSNGGLDDLEKASIARIVSTLDRALDHANIAAGQLESIGCSNAGLKTAMSDIQTTIQSLEKMRQV